jgi:ABC-2 type transport system permease protein
VIQGSGAFVALPVAVVFILPLIGIRAMNHLLLVALIVILVVANLLLMRLGVALFDRESILTRWK